MATIKRKQIKPLRQEKPKVNIPDKLVSVLDDFLSRIDTNKEYAKSKIAAFDLDNSLLLGDIGDASVAHLLENELSPNFTWAEYQKLIYDGQHRKAYIEASKVFAGMEPDCVRRFANVIFTKKTDYITFFENDLVIKVSVPRINPQMKYIVDRLLEEKFKIYIISASNQYLVEEAGKLFGISIKQCFGFKHHLNTIDELQFITPDLIEPLPYAEGKPSVYSKFISDKAPLITGGDSISDIPLLKMTDENGLIFWLGAPNIIAREDMGNRTIVKMNDY